MSKESMAGGVCACGQRIQFTEQHWPHCDMNPVNMSAGAPLLKSLQAKFSKAELADIAAQGPVADKPISRRRA